MNVSIIKALVIVACAFFLTSGGGCRIAVYGANEESCRTLHTGVLFIGECWVFDVLSHAAAETMRMRPVGAGDKDGRSDLVM